MGSGGCARSSLTTEAAASGTEAAAHGTNGSRIRARSGGRRTGEHRLQASTPPASRISPVDLEFWRNLLIEMPGSRRTLWRGPCRTAHWISPKVNALHDEQSQPRVILNEVKRRRVRGRETKLKDLKFHGRLCGGRSMGREPEVIISIFQDSLCLHLHGEAEDRFLKMLPCRWRGMPTAFRHIAHGCRPRLPWVVVQNAPTSKQVAARPRGKQFRMVALVSRLSHPELSRCFLLCRRNTISQN